MPKGAHNQQVSTNLSKTREQNLRNAPFARGRCHRFGGDTVSFEVSYHGGRVGACADVALPVWIDSQKRNLTCQKNIAREKSARLREADARDTYEAAKAALETCEQTLADHPEFTGSVERRASI